MRLEIRRLEERDEQAFLTYNTAMLAEKVAGNVFLEGTSPVTDFKAYLETIRRSERETDSPDWSRSTRFCVFVDGQIVGRITCRWELVGNLPRIGGHIGYGVHKDHRRKGYASQLLNFALDVYRSKGYEKVLVTALVDNLASRQLIEKFGGRLENIIELEDGKELARYWIDL